MSGPIPFGGDEALHRKPDAAAELRPEQWQALARFADTLNALEKAQEGALGQALAETLVKGSGFIRDHDLALITQELVRAVEALSEIGALNAVADNAHYLKNTLSALPAYKNSLADLAQAVEGAREDARTLHGLATRARALDELWAGAGGDAILHSLQQGLSLARGVDFPTIGREILQTLLVLSETGSLQYLTDNLPYVTQSLKQTLNPHNIAAMAGMLETARDDIALVHEAAAWLRNAQVFLAGPAGQALTAGLARVSAAIAEKDLAALLDDALDLLVTWRQIGLFPILTDLGKTGVAAATLWQSANGQEQLSQWLERANGFQESPAWRQIEAALEAFKRGRVDAASVPATGGIKGLYDVLTDARVQQGLRQAAIILQAVVAASSAPDQMTPKKRSQNPREYPHDSA